MLSVKNMSVLKGLVRFEQRIILRLFSGSQTSTNKAATYYNESYVVDVDRDASEILLDPQLSHGSIHETLLAQANNSVIVDVKSQRTSNTKRKLTNVLLAFGEIQYISSISYSKNQYIIQFDKNESVQDLLNRGRDGAIDNHIVSIGKLSDSEDEPENVSKENYFSMTSKLRKHLDSQLTLKDQIEFFVKQLTLPSEDIRTRYLATHLLQNTINKYMDKTYKLYPFGSSLTGAGMPGSDVDIALITQEYENEQFSSLPPENHLIDVEIIKKRDLREKSFRILQDLEGILKDNLPYTTSFELISSARVPLLKLKFSIAELSFDIIVNDIRGINFSRIINWYVRSDPRVAPVLIVVRKWAESRNLVSSGPNYHGFTSFMVQCLVIFYLAKVRVIKPISSLGKQHRESFIFYSPPDEAKIPKKNTDGVDEILLGFFEYFTKYGLKNSRLKLSTGRLTEYSRSFMITNPFSYEVPITTNVWYENVIEMEDEIKKTSRLMDFRKKKLTDREWGLNALLGEKF